MIRKPVVAPRRAPLVPVRRTPARPSFQANVSGQGPGGIHPFAAILVMIMVLIAQGQPPCYGCAPGVGTPFTPSRGFPGGAVMRPAGPDAFIRIIAGILGVPGGFTPQTILRPPPTNRPPPGWFQPAPKTGIPGAGTWGRGPVAPVVPASPSRIRPTGAGAALPGPFARVQQVLGKPYPTSPREITPQVADALLEALGYYAHRRYLDQYWIRKGKVSRAPIAGVRDAALYRAALRSSAIGWVWSDQGRRAEDLDGRISASNKSYVVRDTLFQESQLLAAALEQNRGVTNVDRTSTPGRWNQWVREAAGIMRTEHVGVSLSRDQEEGLIRSMLDQESGQKHWTRYQCLRSNAGAIGASQLMMGNWQEYWRDQNPFDPRGNFHAYARDMNKWMTRFMPRGLRGEAALKRAIAMYNGGPRPGSYARNKYMPAIWRRWKSGSYKR